MKIKVLYFAQIAEKTGVASEEFEFETSLESDDLIKVIFGKYPVLRNMTFKIAVDHHIINAPTALNQNSEVALLPPFAGG